MDQSVGHHRIWGYAVIAAAAFVLAPTMFVTIGWFVQPSFRDSDMSGVHELIVLFVMLLTMPALLLSFGVLAPSAILADRLASARTSRVVNLLLGPLIAIPMLIAFLAGGAMLGSHGDPRKFANSFFRPFAATDSGRIVLMLTFFAALGVIVALGMRHRRRA